MRGALTYRVWRLGRYNTRAGAATRTDWAIRDSEFRSEVQREESQKYHSMDTMPIEKYVCLRQPAEQANGIKVPRRDQGYF